MLGLGQPWRAFAGIVVNAKIKEIQKRDIQIKEKERSAFCLKQKHLKKETNIFNEDLRKMENSDQTEQYQCQIEFTMVSDENEKSKELEIWKVSCLRNQSTKNLPPSQTTLHEEQRQQLIKQLSKLSSNLPKWNCLIDSTTQKSSKFYIAYQISSALKCTRKSACYTKTSALINLSKISFQCQVFTVPFQQSSAIQLPLKYQPNHLRKQSTSTMGSVSETRVSKVRRVSIYSYYDLQTDITLLSTDKLSVEQDQQIQSFTLEQEQSDDDFQIIEECPDPKISTFKKALQEFQYVLDNLNSGIDTTV